LEGDNSYEDHNLDSRRPGAFAWRFSEIQGDIEIEISDNEDSDDSGEHSDRCTSCRKGVNLVKCPACSKSFHYDCKDRMRFPDTMSSKDKCPDCGNESLSDEDEDEDEEERIFMVLEEERAK